MPLRLGLMALLVGCALSAGGKEVNSPNGRIVVNVDVEDGEVVYSVHYDGRTVLNPSKLGLEFEEAPGFSSGWDIEESEVTSVDQSWEQPWGEERQIRDQHNALSIDLRGEEDPERRLGIEFRIFDDGLGFRYQVPEQLGLDRFRLSDEVTRFSFSENLRAWWIPAYRDNRYEYHHAAAPLDSLDVVHTPVTLVGADYAVSLHEAALVDYASMALKRPVMHGQVLEADLVPWPDGVRVRGDLPLTTPWRTIQIADEAFELANSRLILNLNEPNVLGDVDWVEPGRYIGIWWCMHIRECTWATGEKLGATTERAIEYLDFAAEHGFSGVLIEGWNVGWDGDWVQNGHLFDFTQPNPQYDIDRVTAHAREVGVPVIGHHETGANVQNYDSQLEDAFAYLADHDIGVVKTGYVGTRLDGEHWHHGQYMVRHFNQVIRTAARHRVAVNAHEPIKDTGLRRTYPNMLTREGARGGEYDAWGPPQGGNHPEHVAVLPFTRMLAGPFDYTPGVVDLRFGNGQGVSSTLARQLALMVVLYSPLQMAADLPENYEKHPRAFDFIRKVPTDWEDSIALAGEIGDHFVIARKDRHGPGWYLGGVSGSEARSVDVALDFLGEGDWQAEIWRDADDAHWLDNPESWKHETRRVESNDRLTLDMAPGGGVAIRFMPATGEASP